MKNKKGFTLVELLAVIVVLAIIMVIAATSVTSAMKSATVGAFANAHKMLTKDIKQRIVSNELGGTTQITCDDATLGSECYHIYEYSKDDYKMEVAQSGSNYIFSLVGKGKFAEVESDKVIDELSEGVKEFELGDGKEELVLAFDSNANVITDEAKLTVVLDEKIKEESKKATFEYFDLLETAAEEFRKRVNAGEQPGLISFYLNGNTVFAGTRGWCNTGNVGIGIRLNMIFPSKEILGYQFDESAEANSTMDFSKMDNLFSKISIDYFKKIDLKYIDEYKDTYKNSIPNRGNLTAVYAHNTYATTLRKWIGYCYSDTSYQTTVPPKNNRGSSAGIKHYRTIDLENKVLKDLN